MKYVARLFIFIRNSSNRVLRVFMRYNFKKCGKDVKFYAFDFFSYETIIIGDHVYIGRGAKFSAAHATINIGNKVMFGPNVLIRGGNHNTSVIGKYMIDVKDKRSIDDEDVYISDDIWIGANVSILKGVKIGRGSVVAAGAVLTKSYPPYSIIGGIPAKVIKRRFDYEQVKEHEEKLYGTVLTTHDDYNMSTT